MICSVCSIDAPSYTMRPDKTGLLQPICLDCFEPTRPHAFPDGTHPGNRPVTDFADHEAPRLLEKVQAERDALHEALSSLLRAFPELRTGLTSATQQSVLRQARAVLEEVGK